MVRTEFPKLGTAIQVKHVTKFTVQCSTVLRVGKPVPGRSGRMHVELRQAPSR